MFGISQLVSGNWSGSEGSNERHGGNLLAIDGEAAREVFDALSSVTAREILTALHERPRTASEVAAAVDTSLSNVSHHLDQLEDCDLVTVVRTEDARNNQEANVYAPATECLALVAGDLPGRRSSVTSELSVGKFLLAAGVSALAVEVVRRLV